VSVLNGTVGEMHSRKICNLYDMALKTSAPVIGLLDCAGLRLQEATDALNAFGKDNEVILISNHINAGGGEGAEVVYGLRNDSTLAQSILDNIASKGQKPRKIYQRRLPENPSKDYYYIIRETNPLQSLLVEYGFIDNANDARKLQNNLLDYVEGVVEAIANYIGVPYTTEQPDIIDSSQYTVKKGDTLYSIARKLGVSVDELKKRNNLTNNNIYIGQQLYIPGKQDIIVDPEFGTYTVKAGDTIFMRNNK